MVALIVLLLVAGATTRGYLPGVEHTPRRVTAAGPGQLIVLAVLLAVSMGVVAIATVHRMRHRRAAAGSIGELSATAGAQRGTPSWRMLLIGLAVLAASLLALVVLVTLSMGLRFGIPAELFGSRGGAPTSPPAPGAPAPPTPHPAPGMGGPHGEVFGYLLAVAGTLAVVTAAGIVASRTRRAPRRPPATPTAPATAQVPSADETLTRAAELGLARIADRSRGPREAIIACYAVMERHLADVPAVAPRDFDTPTEVLARAVEHHALAAANASRLVDLFAEARFSPHLMTERHRADAVEHLRLVLTELRAPT